MDFPSSKLDDSAPAPGAAPAIGFPVETQQVWSTGLFDCADDCGNCCMTCWCPCVTFGRIAEIADGGSTSCGASGALYTLIAAVTGCQWIYSCFYRSKLRAHYNLPESPCCDCCVHFWCEPCAMCQEYRELQGRGFDMTIGWHLNMERNQQAGGMVGMTPPPTKQDGMMR